jgi:predicted RNase H-like nuclease (RuvC/YqgF family)
MVTPSTWKTTALLIRSIRFSPFALVLLSGSLLACDSGEKKELRTKLQNTQAQLQFVQAKAEDRDKLYDEVMDAARFVSDVQVELSNARARYTHGKTRLTAAELERPTRSRAELLGDLKQVLAHLDSVERRVATLEKSSPKMSTMSEKIISLQRTIASLRAAALDQQQQLENLTAQLASTTRERDDLAGKVVTMTDVANTVYMIAKPLPELLKSGVLVEEGGGKFLGLGPKRGQTYVPGRNLQPSDFTTLNMATDSVLTLPPGHPYQIASRHNGALLSPAPNNDGLIPSRVRITDPTRFWSTSRFLILIER